MPKLSLLAQRVEDLLYYSNNHLYLSAADNIYIRNKLLYKLQIPEPAQNYTPPPSLIKLRSPSELLRPVMEHALSNGLTTEESKVFFETEIMDILCPPPSFIQDIFDQTASEQGVKAACDFLYDFCIKSNYIRFDEVSANLCWTAECEKANLEITVNISRPEKNNKDTAKLLVEPSDSYPKCMLCKENQGYHGHTRYPSRLTLRTIPLILNNEQWYFQYSPYKYFNEHCIVFADKHVPMDVNARTILNLLDFVNLFPSYFLGSNAALPRIGGSILNHDHYQGGGELMPLHKAKAKHRFVSEAHPDARITIPDWYNNVIRIESRNRDTIISLYTLILDGFKGYSNAKLNIAAKTGKTEYHNGLSPILRRNSDNEYSLDILLRNNRCDEANPDGIFHVSADLHNIKQESIGLIEAMGVFILPGRLAHEADGIRAFLTGESKFAELKDPAHPLVAHTGMIAQLIQKHGVKLNEEEAGQAIEQYINNACERMLKCVAIFKDTPEGEKAFLKLMKDFGFLLINS